ncbi:molybdate transport system substrate-binding protein [Crenobacter luteus]|uniref:Molybdate ABC transporter substrate-binding protein n=1 Tax=Crenobacter luteus TaxID=1452487 RepID=A0A161SAN1_9NEIS|nr:molybdate ABC transporter substrate-binding protein [Crenobacter luteus]KZE32853.1 hypothetical protein AVW16_10745 [Crenobacter luteus]TCP14856.1 molybdate transport system substrate-binding protein [Crenobacter luteus]
MPNRLKKSLLLLTMGAAFAAPAWAAPLYIAAASDLIYCLEELNASFMKQAPKDTEIKLSAGSSGNFFAQIQNGAPFHVYMSADMKYPRELAKSGYADAASLTPYAIGQIVVWTKRDDLDVNKGLKLVNDPKVKRFAIANPEHAPYGVAAVQALQTNKLYATAQPKFVLGENISQTAQFVQTGNADAGVVALALVKSPKLANVGRYKLIPTSEHAEMLQGAVLTNKGSEDPVARQYIAYLRSPEARAIFEKYGFMLPKKKGV